MKRRNFLAFMPAISAIPFVGVDIIKKENKIEIIKPKLIEKSSDLFDINKCEVHLVQEGRLLGKGHLTNVDISQEYADINKRGDGPFTKSFPTIKTMHIQAIMNGLVTI